MVIVFSPELEVLWEGPVRLNQFHQSIELMSVIWPSVRAAEMIAKGLRLHSGHSTFSFFPPPNLLSSGPPTPPPAPKIYKIWPFLGVFLGEEKAKRPPTHNLVDPLFLKKYAENGFSKFFWGGGGGRGCLNFMVTMGSWYQQWTPWSDGKSLRFSGSPSAPIVAIASCNNQSWWCHQSHEAHSVHLTAFVSLIWRGMVQGCLLTKEMKPQVSWQIDTSAEDIFRGLQSSVAAECHLDLTSLFQVLLLVSYFSWSPAPPNP